MGFFKLSQRSHIASKQEDNFTFDDDYIRKSQRIPSAGNDDYENGDFKSHFEEDRLEHKKSKRDGEKIRSHRFTKVFRRKEKAQSPDYTSSPEDDCRIEKELSNSLDTYTSTKVTEKEVNSFQEESDDTSIQDSNVKIQTSKRHRSLRISWRSKRDVPSSSIKSSKSNKRSGFRSFFSRSKGPTSVPSENKTESSVVTSSVYDVQETLTQRYMKDSSGLNQLLQDMDAIPFDLSVKKENTFHEKVTKVIQSLSPSKKSPEESTSRSDKDAEDDYSQDFETWNPYGRTNNKDKVDRISITSSEFELSKKYNVNLSVQRRPSKLGSFARSLSLRAKGKLRSHLNSDESLKEKEKEKFKENNEELSTNQKESLSSLFGQNVTKASPNGGNNYQSDFSSASSTTVAGNDDLFGKLYAKALDAVDKGSPSIENFSGSTKISTPSRNESDKIENIEDPKTPIEKSTPKPGSDAYHNVIVNVATIDDDTYDSEEVSSFLQDFYEPSRPTTKRDSRKTSCQLSRSNSRAFGSVRRNPLEFKKETQRPLTAVELFQKELDENKQELEELSFQIIRDRNHHRKVINGLPT